MLCIFDDYLRFLYSSFRASQDALRSVIPEECKPYETCMERDDMQTAFFYFHTVVAARMGMQALKSYRTPAGLNEKLNVSFGPITQRTFFV